MPRSSVHIICFSFSFFSPSLFSNILCLFNASDGYSSAFTLHFQFYSTNHSVALAAAAAAVVNMLSLNIVSCFFLVISDLKSYRINRFRLFFYLFPFFFFFGLLLWNDRAHSMVCLCIHIWFKTAQAIPIIIIFYLFIIWLLIFNVAANTFLSFEFSCVLNFSFLLLMAYKPSSLPGIGQRFH